MQNIKARALPLASIVLILIVLLTAVAFTFSTSFAAKPPAPVLLDPKTIPKYVNQLVVPPVYVPATNTTALETYSITMDTTRQQILPTGTVLVGNLDGMTNVWGYKGDAITRGATLGPAGTLLPGFIYSPSSTLEATRGKPVKVEWINNINVPHPFAVDPTLKWADPTGLFGPADAVPQPFPAFPPGWNGPPPTDELNAQAPVPLVPHLHGAEVLSDYDGGPDAWFTNITTPSNVVYKGANYRTYEPTTVPNAAVYYYPNAQEANTLWYHDHALGITRINVMSGLAGFYPLRESVFAEGPGVNTFDQLLTRTFQYGVSEIPVAIQDRTFKNNGELWFPEVGINPTIHPYWFPEFFGDTIMVNGRVWPNLDVTPGLYRLRLLDGSNARFYTISFKDQTTGLKLPFIQIGADGGYLTAPVTLKELTIAPGERADILIDFTASLGNRVIMENKAKAPFPNGAQPNPQTTGQIMQFTVKTAAVTQGVDPLTFALPLADLNPTLGAAFPTLQTFSVRRIITLNEIMGLAGPVMAVINGQYYDGIATEKPANGATEEWVIVNLTGDTHPIHTHLATFQLVSRQKLKALDYEAAWLNLNSAGGTPPFTPRTYVPVSLDPAGQPNNPINYLYGKVVGPTPSEMGWKDTLQMHPGEVTTIRIRFAQQDGTPYPFLPNLSGAPGYVWHCHIIDHEDNEMMRPFEVLP